ncbi:c-type cytochrome biogenesis protein CcmI [Roseobacteraceae bacterium NS-SX3]
MVFWIVTAFMALAIAALIALVLLRAREQGEPAAAYDMRVYRQQLRDVEKDLARGVIAEGDASRIRTEISRRILAADAQLQKRRAGQAQPRGLSLAAALVSGAVLLGGTLGLYAALGAPGYGDLGLKDRIALAKIRAETRPSQAEAETQAPALPAPEPSEEYLKLVEQLRETAAARKDDAQGQALLAQHEANLGNFKAAYEAKQNYIRIMGGGASADDYGQLAELMIMAAGGYVSPEAEAALQQSLNRDPANGPARYYWGLMLGQTGRPDLAYEVWAQTLAQGPAGAPWIEGIQRQIEDMAFRAGVDYQPIEPRGAATGPTAEDVENAQQMSAQERQEMIRGMVTRLSDRLASEGGPAQDWARLIGALGVLGDTERAKAVYDEAAQRFAEDAGALALLKRAGEQAGVAE